ncbi:CRISP-associated protein Cas1 [Paenibacillus sp. cl130]|jgi:CRISPR-associated protein Cas1|nr:CRISPR-associated protein Cas1 [Paenibacillus sp. PvR133]SFQ96463.1 CRISP-associated protein Cas1 [Paenibacillus sp. cl130]
MTEQPPLGRTSGERLFIRNHEGVREVRSWRFYVVWRETALVQYNSVWDDLILQQKDDFYFHGRHKRPSLDNVNALLSFAYTLLSNDMKSALEAVGLDAYVGFLHRDRPGRA